METALIVVGLIALGLGFAVFVLYKGVSAERVKFSGLGKEMRGKGLGVLPPSRDQLPLSGL